MHNSIGMNYLITLAGFEPGSSVHKAGPLHDASVESEVYLGELMSQGKIFAAR
jgi:hypothetical protein